MALDLLDKTYESQIQNISPVKSPKVTNQIVRGENHKTSSQQNRSGRPLLKTLFFSLVLITLIGAAIYYVKQSTQKYAHIQRPQNIKGQVLSSQTPLSTVTPSTKATSESITTPPLLPTTTPKSTETPVVVFTPSKPTPTATPIEEKVTTENEKKEEDNKLSLRPMPINLYTYDNNLDEETFNTLLPLKYRNRSKYSQNIAINAINSDCWITYKVDQGPVRKFIVRKGNISVISGEEVRLFIGNISGVKLFHNNKPLIISSSSGVKSLVFPKENARKYSLPLFIFQKDGTVIPSSD